MLNSLCTGLKLSGKIFDQRDVKFLVKDDLMESYCSRYKFLNGKLSMPLQFSQNVFIRALISAALIIVKMLAR